MDVRTLLGRLIAAGEDHQKSPRHALGVPSLRPYLPGRRHLRRVLRGLVVLAKMAWKVSREGLRRATAPPAPKAKKQQPKEAAKDSEKKDEQPGFLDALERAGAAVLVGVIACAAAAGAVSTLWTQFAPHARTVIGVAVVALLTAAWIVGPKPKAEEPAGEPQQHDAGGEAQPEPAPLPQPLDVDAVAAAVRQIAAAGRWRGAHLDDVLAHLPGRSRAELLAVLAEAGIPIEEQLKLRLPGGRQRNRQGIRLAHLPPAPAQPAAEAPPETPLPTPVEAAPEPAPPALAMTVYGTE